MSSLVRKLHIQKALPVILSCLVMALIMGLVHETAQAQVQICFSIGLPGGGIIRVGDCDNDDDDGGNECFIFCPPPPRPEFTNVARNITGDQLLNFWTPGLSDNDFGGRNAPQVRIRGNFQWIAENTVEVRRGNRIRFTITGIDRTQRTIVRVILAKDNGLFNAADLTGLHRDGQNGEVMFTADGEPLVSQFFVWVDNNHNNRVDRGEVSDPITILDVE